MARICQFCKSEIPEGARFCMKCGKGVSVRFCQHCGAELPESARFCMKCGKETASVTPQPTPPVTPVPPPPPPQPVQPLQSVSAPPPPPPVAPLQYQPPPPPRKKSNTGMVILITVLAVVGVIAVVYAVKSLNLFSSTVSAEQNSALWKNAHTALINFVGEGMKTFGRDASQPATSEELAAMSKSIDDFSNAVKKLAGVNPPEKITHRALLPIYQEMQTHMTNIRDKLLSPNPSDADLEWNQLAALLDQTEGVMAVLSPEISPTPTPTTTAVAYKTVLPLPSGVPAKPANLLATDAEYYLMYSAAKSWGVDFNQSFSTYSQQGIQNNWPSMWFGSDKVESQRLYFDKAGDKWKPQGMPAIPSNFPSKPSNLSASDADYLLMYLTYTGWGYDFASAFAKYSASAVSSKWTTWWMGSETDQQKRLHFHAIGDKWALD